MRKRIVASLLAAASLSAVCAQSAYAVDPPINPASMNTSSGGVYFAQQCDLPGTSARGRVIYTSLDVQDPSVPQGNIDASLIKWQALSTSGAQASWWADQVKIQVRDAGVWVDWKVLGGSVNGGTDVNPITTWNPDQTFHINEYYTGIRMYVKAAGGSSCITSPTTLS